MASRRQAVVGRRGFRGKGRPTTGIQRIGKQQPVRRGELPPVGSEQQNPDVALGGSLMRVPSRCEPHPRAAGIRLGMEQAEAPDTAGPHSPTAVLEDRVDHVGRQSFFLSVADPLTVLEPVQPRAGSHPQDAIAGGRNGSKAI